MKQKIALMILVLAILTGCGYTKNDDIILAQELCANNGGLSMIQIDMNVRTAVCNNSARFNLNKNRGKK